MRLYGCFHVCPWQTVSFHLYTLSVTSEIPTDTSSPPYTHSLPMGENQTHASNCFQVRHRASRRWSGMHGGCYGTLFAPRPISTLLTDVLTQGTPGYAAPEVLSRGRLSLAADVWSFGVLLLELCHGMRFKRIIAQCATAGGMPPHHPAGDGGPGGSGVAGAAAAYGADVATAPWWASAVPATCPPQLTELVWACLRLSPPARPSFDQVRARCGCRALCAVLAVLIAVARRASVRRNATLW